jgi:putative mRNA 3-end processing factor
MFPDSMRASDLLHPRPEGLYCPPADVFIDPMRPVPRALVTHGHADHARAGHGAVLATRETLAIMAARYGARFADSTQAIAHGEAVHIGDVTISFHPAGHVLGSAQIALEHKGLRIVVSGDYKREEDPTCLPFAPVPCDVFVSEATFGLPVFRHPPALAEVDKLMQSIALFPERAHLLGAYALGKAQRMMALLRSAGYDRPIWLHGAMETLTQLYQAEGIDLGDVRPMKAANRAETAGCVVLCPPGQLTDLWARKLPDPVTALASGWMRIRARARQRGAELPLVVSDHADWDDLCRTITETGCRELWVTHGQEDALVHWATGQGIAARPLNLVGYGDEGEAEPAEAASPAPGAAP